MRGFLLAAVGLFVLGSSPALAQHYQWQWPAMVGPGKRDAVTDGTAVAQMIGHSISDSKGQVRLSVGPLYYYSDLILTNRRWIIGDIILNNPTDIDYCYTIIGSVYHQHTENGTPLAILFWSSQTVLGQPEQQYIAAHSWVTQFRGVDDANRWFTPQESGSLTLTSKVAFAVWPRDTSVPLADSCNTKRPKEYDAWSKSDLNGVLHDIWIE